MLASSLALFSVFVVALVHAQPAQLSTLTVHQLMTESSVKFNAFDREFVLNLGRMEKSFSDETSTVSSYHRDGTVGDTAHSQILLNFFSDADSSSSSSSSTRAYGVIEIEGGSEKQRTFDLETTTSGDLLLVERPRVGLLYAADPVSAAEAAGTHPVDFIYATETIPESELAENELAEDEESEHASVSEDSKRSRRGGPASSAHSACRVFLDIDMAFYKQWGVGSSEAERTQAAINKASAYLSAASQIYQTNFGGAIQLEIGGAHVFTTSDLGAGSVTEAGAFLNKYGEFLVAGATGAAAPKVRGSMKPSAQEVCLNIAVTHRNFGSVVGVAYVASKKASTVGGICSTYIGGARKRAYNTGFVDSWGSRDATVMSRGIAHEIGHAFGAEHSCCDGTCGCATGGSCGNSFLMYWMLSYGSNGSTFSPCSRSQISAVVAAKGNCFTQPGSKQKATRVPTRTTSKAAVTTKKTKKNSKTTKKA